MNIVCNPEILPELKPIMHLYETKTDNLHSLRFIKKIKDYDLVVTNWPGQKKSLYLRIALALYPQKKLVIFVNLQESSFKLSRRDIKLFLRADRIICSNLESARHGSLAKIYWKAPEKFRETPYGIDLKKYSPRDSFLPSENEIVAKFKAMINIVTKKVIKKGLPTILVSAKDVKDWQDILNNEHLNGKVIYSDYYETDIIKKVKELQSADIFVVPINEGPETICQIIQALACGLVVVAPRSTRLINVFDHGKQGLLFKANDNNDLIQRILNLCKDEEKRESMSRESRKLAETRYDKKQRDEKIQQIFKELFK